MSSICRYALAQWRKREAIGCLHTDGRGSHISQICTWTPRQTPGHQDRHTTTRGTCGILLLLLHQQEPAADVTCKRFWAAWSQQAALQVDRVLSALQDALPRISWPKQVNITLPGFHLETALRSWCSHRYDTHLSEWRWTLYLLSDAGQSPPCQFSSASMSCSSQTTKRSFGQEEKHTDQVRYSALCSATYSEEKTRDGERDRNWNQRFINPSQS